MKKKIKKVVSEKEISKKVEKEIKSDDLFDAFIKGYGKDASEESKKLFSTIFPEYIKQELSKHADVSKYNILVLFDNTILVKGDSDQIYRAVTGFKDASKPLLLILLSGGGEPGSAYLKIGRAHV